MAKRYFVHLSAEERESLLGLSQRGRAAARTIRRALTLLLAVEGKSDESIAQVLHVGVSTVQRTRRRLAEEGLRAALEEHPRPGGRRRLSIRQQAVLAMLTSSPPPSGHQRWTTDLLAEELLRRGIVQTLSDETVRRALRELRPRSG